MGARIANRVVAIFDNDAVGRDSARKLAGFALPPNIRVLVLPNLASAELYPTIGPSGSAFDNVNGRAGSIELYFGADVLREGDDTTMPVRWAGFVAGIGGYQGELVDKSALHARFAAKIEATLSNPDLRATQDWAGMGAVIDAIRAAFR